MIGAAHHVEEMIRTLDVTLSQLGISEKTLYNKLQRYAAEAAKGMGSFDAPIDSGDDNITVEDMIAFAESFGGDSDE